MGAAAVLALAAVGGWFLFGRSAGSGGGRISQIAVLPFQDLSGKDKVFVDAMHDALIGALVRKSVVGVVSRNEVLRFKDGSSTTAEIAKALHADAVMETTVFRDGERMRINAQLVEPVSLRYVWAQTYERDVKDVLQAQREIVDTIAADVAGTLRKPTPSTYRLAPRRDEHGGPRRLPREGLRAHAHDCLTPGPGDYHQAEYSPDGTRLAYRADKGGKWAVFTSALDGSGAVAVSPQASLVLTPRWSPDGKSIAYVSTAAALHDVWVVPSGGGEARRLTSDPSIEFNARVVTRRQPYPLFRQPAR